MNFPLFRSSLWLALLGVPLVASAVGLGELRGQPAMGERLRLEIDIVGSARRSIEASCFRLIRPEGADDLPWLRQGNLSVRSGPVLEIRSASPLRDPILQIGVQLGCGYEISRQYMLLALPAAGAATPAGEPVAGEAIAPPVALPPRRAVRQRPAARADEPAPPRLTARRAEPRRSAPSPRDRLMLSGGGAAGDLPLQLATELSSLAGGLTANEAQREIMRLEFRMLMVLNEQALTQMATAEKLRNMEGTLGELRQLAGGFAERVEKEAPVGLPPADATVAPAPAPTIRNENGAPRFSAWNLYGALLGALLGLGGWLAWRQYVRRRQQQEAESFPLLAADQVVVPEGPAADEVGRTVDIRVEPARTGVATPIDVELDGGDAVSARPMDESRVLRPVARDSVMSLEATTVDEHFEANPVMELADIMLSFGRVKGAAQALQEYIDTNPEEALQPWIRLMDVYRLAGMRNEFENVARNLNQHFNVEVQHWEQQGAVAVDLDLDDGSPRAPRAESLEDLPRIISMVGELWWTGDVVGYLYQLLRDNRGGKRAGFALPLVEEILFLIELKETSNRIAKKD